MAKKEVVKDTGAGAKNPALESALAQIQKQFGKEAIMKMRWALSEFIVDGIDSNIDFQLRLIKNKSFEAGTYDNSFLERFLQEQKEHEQ